MGGDTRKEMESAGLLTHPWIASITGLGKGQFSPQLGSTLRGLQAQQVALTSCIVATSLRHPAWWRG